MKFKGVLFFLLCGWWHLGGAQEVYFFTEGTNNTFYDQGIVDLSNMGGSFFETTHPPGLPQYNDKVPCSTTAFRGSTSLKFNYTSAANGNWRVTIYSADWSSANISGMDSIAFFVYSETEILAAALPLIGIRAQNKNGAGDVNSQLFPLANYNQNVQPKIWTKIKFPLSVLFNDSQSSQLDFTRAKGVIFNQSEKNGLSGLIFVDDVLAYKNLATVPPVTNLEATGYDSHAELNWVKPMDGLSYQIEASFDNGVNFQVRGHTILNYFLDFVPEEGKNKEVFYKVTALFQQQSSNPVAASATLRHFTDDELMDMVQRYAFRYFWEGAHQPSGMALERTNGNGITVASGATGMGLMAMIVAYEREYRPRSEIKERILKILHFLESCQRHYGAWSHWYNGNTMQTQPFSPDDDGGDIVETSFVAQALLALRNYFGASDSQSVQIRQKATKLWREINWDWYRNSGHNVLFWHWSPNIGFAKNMKVSGWNECLVTYIMAASSPTFPVSRQVYDQGWARNGQMVRKRSFYNFEISLSPDWGGPLFWIHYSHLGINPKGLKDQYADYWKEHVNTAKIHIAYAIENPFRFPNYSAKNWGLTASDGPFGYRAHEPMFNDNGTISPTAALSSMPYTPEESMNALKYFYRERGKDLFGKFGPYDAFNDAHNWVQRAYIGIDQGPIVVMIENHRSQLLWNSVMRDEDLQAGLTKLGFQFVASAKETTNKRTDQLKVFPNPSSGQVTLNLPVSSSTLPGAIEIVSPSGRIVRSEPITPDYSYYKLDLSGLPGGFYIIRLKTGNKIYQAKLILHNN